MLDKNTTPLEGLKYLVLLSVELVIGNRTLKIMWLLLAIAMWYLVGFNQMILFISELIGLFFVVCSALFLTMAHVASNKG